MSGRRLVCAVLACLLSACMGGSAAGGAKPTRDTQGGRHELLDTVFRVADRHSPPPKGYGLYSVMLVRSANRNAVALVTELFATTTSAQDAAIAPENLNLLTLPVRDAADASRDLARGRETPGPSAGLLLARHYDYGQAALLLASICRPDRGEAVMKVCGSTPPDGPILVTALRPIDPANLQGQSLLVVNVGGAPAAAVPEIVAAYKRQILRKDFTDRVEVDSWRLSVLNAALRSAQLLPGISTAIASVR